MIFVCIFLTENIYFTAYYVNLITIACSQWIVWCVNFGYMLYLGKRFSLLFLPFFPIAIQRFDAFLFECNHFGSFCWGFFLFFFSHHTHLPFVWFVFRRDKMRSIRKTSTKYIKLFMYGLRNRFVIISLVVVVGHDMNNSCTHPLPLVSPSPHTLCIQLGWWG